MRPRLAGDVIDLTATLKEFANFDRATIFAEDLIDSRRHFRGHSSEWPAKTREELTVFIRNGPLICLGTSSKFSVIPRRY